MYTVGLENKHGLSFVFFWPVIDKFTQHIGGSKEYGGSPAGVEDCMERRRKLMDLLPTDRSELPARRMKDSFVTAVIPLSRDPVMRERYVTYYGTVRVGRLLEDLDVFAGR